MLVLAHRYLPRSYLSSTIPNKALNHCQIGVSFIARKARQIVVIWEKLFNSSPKEKRIPFLYLANDILQNSRRKGSEFVNEFWKVLPGSLKVVYEDGEENIKKVVLRLVSIWDERKVFGSRGRGLKDDILGNARPPLSESNGKSSNAIKLMKKDAHSIRIKLAVGGMPEKIVTAYQAALDEHFEEDMELNKCQTAVLLVENMEKDFNDVYVQGSPLMGELEEQEMVLKHCIQQLEQVEATRAALIARLKEAILEQEPKLELVRTQLQVARIKAEHANNMRQKLASSTTASGTCASNKVITASVTPQLETTLTTAPLQPLRPQQPATSTVNSLTSAEEEHKKAAAAVAAKLAASTSSAQMLTSVLSSLVAEEAASMNGGHSSLPVTNNNPMFPIDKRPKLEKPMSVADISGKFLGHMAPQQQLQFSSLPLGLTQSSATTIQPITKSNQALQSYPLAPPIPNVPPPSVQPYMQTTGGPMGMVPFGFNGSPLPPPPPLPVHASLGMRLNPPLQLPPQTSQQQQQQQALVLPQQSQSSPQPQQQPTTGSFYPPAGIGFIGQIPPVPRQ
ncbi:hypothetical protein HPP92_007505 [Vanilla planifolia]|uniref:CID domain-containing protein n=1 Tax=Vanilla planifolia TaxID=51239 RepID=A0A835V5Z0_VANPL|nr:hypothetical protein HPP92_007505 [Vanilla planifolia]